MEAQQRRPTRGAISEAEREADMYFPRGGQEDPRSDLLRCKTLFFPPRFAEEVSDSSGLLSSRVRF